ncbi:hypothetical protein GA830_00625 [Mesorhizobium sp. NBSH29]|uniref:hypothetical protein n=1 Tax=Mesorhizobium sp. NBSH29 TaxID=2654249 RepID=UPI00189684A2|nr:hypothetical protein [Mesorhizobium sp. NBSH29]QPC85414.1 hypothetical protein GA830_00625 [Mesorhizobium sp. NBSH29]
MSDYSLSTLQNAPARAPVDAALVQFRPASLSSIIGRIEEAVDDETASINTDVNFDVKASNARKSRYLYELTRAMKGFGDASDLAVHRDGIIRLHDKLAANEAAIKAHLSAVGEVAALLQDAIRASETDGTYSAGQFGGAG